MLLASNIIRNEINAEGNPFRGRSLRPDFAEGGSDSLERTEVGAARAATRQLEAGDPLCALTLLREVRLRRSKPAEAAGVITPMRSLRSHIDQAIREIELSHPGHALRTLRIALGRAPLG